MFKCNVNPKKNCLNEVHLGFRPAESYLYEIKFLIVLLLFHTTLTVGKIKSQWHEAKVLYECKNEKWYVLKSVYK